MQDTARQRRGNRRRHHGHAQTFAEGKVTGSAGCNTYTGTYTLDGDKLTIAGLTVTDETKKTCDSPRGIMDQEAIYLANLAGAVRLIQTAGVLQLLNADDETSLALCAHLDD